MALDGVAVGQRLAVGLTTGGIAADWDPGLVLICLLVTLSMLFCGGTVLNLNFARGAAPQSALHP